MDNKNGSEMLFKAFEQLDNDILEAAAEHGKKDYKRIRTVKAYPSLKRAAALLLCLTVTVLSVLTAGKLKNTGNTAVSSNHTASDNVSHGNSGISSSESSASSSASLPGKTAESPSKTPSVGSEIQGSSSQSGGGISKPEKNNDSDNSGSSGSTVPSSGFSIKSLDMLNFFAGKRTLEIRSLLPMSGILKPIGSKIKPLRLADNKIYYYELDRNTEFTLTMVTYFTVKLHNEKGFLAQRLGGTGDAEVIVTENNLENMITFKRDDNYFSCLLNSSKEAPGTDLKSYTFSTHKYTDGFEIVKNFSRDNYYYTVGYDDLRVTDISCRPAEGSSSAAVPDDMELTDDIYMVLRIRQSFTIAELEDIYGGADA